MVIERVVCLNCIDGRIQLPVINWIKESYDVHYVDMITEPGIDGFLSDESMASEDVFRKVRISIKNNDAKMIFIVGHHDCTGNPVSDEIHKEQIILSVERVKKEFTDMDIVGCWVNSDFKAEVLLRGDEV